MSNTSQTMKKSINLDFINFWNEDISDTNPSRYLFYNKVKYKYFKLKNDSLLSDDPVLKKNTHFTWKIRTSTHLLLIEEGQHLSIDRKDQIYPVYKVLKDQER